MDEHSSGKRDFAGISFVEYLSVSEPLGFRLVIQVLLSPYMFLNACVYILGLGFKSHP